MNHVKRGRHFVRKVTALLLVLTFVFTLPVVAQDMPEGAMLIEWMTQNSWDGETTQHNAYVIGATYQRTLHGIEDALTLDTYVMESAGITALLGNLANEGLLTEDDWNLLINFNRWLAQDRAISEGLIGATDSPAQFYFRRLWQEEVQRQIKYEEIPQILEIIERAVEHGTNNWGMWHYDNFLTLPVVYANTSTNLYFVFERGFFLTPYRGGSFEGNLPIFCAGCGSPAPNNAFFNNFCDYYGKIRFYTTLTEPGVFRANWGFDNATLFFLIVEGEATPQPTPTPSPQPTRPTSVPSLPQN